MAQPRGRASYAAANGGILNLTWDLAWEFRNHSITVNAIAPMAYTRDYSNSSAYHQKMDEAGLFRKKRIGEIEERPHPVFVPSMLLYLASYTSAKVNGYIFRVGDEKIALYYHSIEILGIYRNFKKDSKWSLDELKELLPATVLSEITEAPHIQ